MSHNPCHHNCDWTDGDEPDVTDAGCCSPAPVRRTCEAPVLPVQQCPDEVTEMIYDEETESFTLVGQLLDESCEPIQDENGDDILVIIT